MNKFQYATLLISLVILSVILLSIFFRKKSPIKNSSLPKNTGISADKTCSATNCGQTGTSYRSAICIDPSTNLQVDSTKCDTSQKLITQPCTNPTCSPWNYSAWTPSTCDLCIGKGTAQTTQTRTATCSSTTDPVNGCDPSQQILSQPCSSPVCGSNSYHGSYNGTVALTSSSIFNPTMSVSGSISNSVSVSGNTITLTPIGNNIYGIYFCMFVWYSSTSTKNMNTFPPVKTLNNITLINAFSAGTTKPYNKISNVGSESTIVLITSMVIYINDPTKVSSITFDTTATLPVSPLTSDIFITQLNNSLISCFSGSDLISCSNTYGTSRFPYMAIYRFTGGASLSTNYFSNPIQIFDSFDSKTTPATATSRITFSTNLITIPPFTTAATSTYSTLKFLLFFQITPISNSASMNVSSISVTNITWQILLNNKKNYGISTTSNTYSSNMIYACTFSIADPTKASTITITLGIGAPSLSGIDFLLLQLDPTIS